MREGQKKLQRPGRKMQDGLKKNQRVPENQENQKKLRGSRNPKDPKQHCQPGNQRIPGQSWMHQKEMTGAKNWQKHNQQIHGKQQIRSRGNGVAESHAVFFRKEADSRNDSIF